MDGEDLIICFVLYIGFALRLDVFLGWFEVIRRTPQERRSARACAVQARFRLSQFCTFSHRKLFDCARAPFLSAQAWRLRICLATRSAYACAVQARVRPSHLGVLLEPFSLKCTGFVRLGLALLRLSHAWLFSARNVIRSRLCGPTTYSPRPFFRSFPGNLFF